MVTVSMRRSAAPGWDVCELPSFALVKLILCRITERKQNSDGQALYDPSTVKLWIPNQTIAIVIQRGCGK